MTLIENDDDDDDGACVSYGWSFKDLDINSRF